MRNKPVRFGVAVLVALGLGAHATSAAAFCRTSTQGLRGECTIGGDECCTIGKPLFWKNACVGYSMQKDASKQVSLDDAQQAITRAFTKWTGTSCTTDGSGQSRVSIDVRDLGPVSCGNVEYNKEGSNQHVIVFRDTNWSHADSNNTLALTTVTFSPETGEIYDADMEINTAQQRVQVSDPVPPDGFDFASIVTHETGHFLGLAHSTDPHATMYAHYKQGATAMRNLTADDVKGVCAIYPPDGTRVAADDVKIPGDVCDPTPRHGFTGECATPPKKTCAVSAPGRPSPDLGVDGLVVLGLALGCGARRATRRSARSRAR
jgi:hypothetical protein